ASNRNQDTKKPRRSRGFLSDVVSRSVTDTTDNRSTPVEAINQRSADGLNERMEGDVATDQSVGPVDQLVDVLLVVIGSAGSGFHEPTGRAEAKDVEVVLDAATNKPALAV